MPGTGDRDQYVIFVLFHTREYQSVTTHRGTCTQVSHRCQPPHELAPAGQGYGAVSKLMIQVRTPHKCRKERVSRRLGLSG